MDVFDTISETSSDEVRDVFDELPDTEVIRDVPHGTLEPTDLLPGIRKIGGDIVPGQLGDTHQDIIMREGIKAEDLDQRVFVTPWGDVMDREASAQAVFPKVIPQFEPGRLHSTDLNALQTPGEFENRLQAAAEEEGAKPLFKIPEPSEQFQKIAYGPTRAIYGEKFADTYKSINDTIVNAAKSVPEFLSTEEGMLSMLASLNPLGRAGVEAYFTYDMAKNLWDQAKSGIKDWDSLTIPQKASRITQGAVTLGFLGLLSKAGLGTVKGAIKTPSKILYPTAKEAPPAERPGEAPLAAPTEGKAEVGEVVQAAPTEPAITTDKTVLPQKQVELRTPSDIAKELGIEAQESVGNFDRYLFKHKKNAEQLSVPKGSGPEVVKAQMEKALARWITPDEVLKASDAEIQSIPQGKELSDRIGSEMTEEQLKAAEPVIVEYLKKQASDKKLLDEGKIGVEEYAQRVMEARTKGKLLVDVFAGLNRPLPEIPAEARTTVQTGLGLPAPKEGTVRVYSGGEDSPWYSTNLKRANEFAKVAGGAIRYVDVPREVFDAGVSTAKQQGSFTPGDTILPNEWVNKSADLRADLKKKSGKIKTLPTPEPTPAPPSTDLGIPSTVAAPKAAAKEITAADIQNANRYAMAARAKADKAQLVAETKDMTLSARRNAEKVAASLTELADKADAEAANLREQFLAQNVAPKSLDKYSDSELIAEWDRLLQATSTAEKTPKRRMSKEEVESMRKDWRSYSKSRGYSEQEIADFDRWLQVDAEARLRGIVSTVSKAVAEPINLEMELGAGIVPQRSKVSEALSHPKWKPVGGSSSVLFGTNAWTLDTANGMFRIHRLAGPNAGKFAVNFVGKDGTKTHIGVFRNITEAKRSVKTNVQESQPTPSETSSATPINLEIELGAGVSLKGVSDAVRASVEYLKSLRNEELKAPKMTDRRRAVLNWSAKLQRSYGEAFSKQRDIIKAVPNQTRREGITNWIQANGDRTVLQDRYNATSDPKLKAGYKAALELTPDEIAVANSIKSDYANFASRGQAADVLGDLKDNYVTQTWDLGRGPGGLGTGRTLKEKFRFSKARTFESFFEGEQAGYTPKTKDIARLLPMYSHEMNSVIAAREMVAEMGGGVASDGRPLLAPKGIGIPVDSAEGGKAMLVLPKVGKADISDYKVLPNQPALSGWKWVAKDDAGNPVFLKADLAIHPEAFAHLRSVLGRSAIREWFGTRTTSLSELPKMIVKGIDMANSETKRTMLGLLATFHQIQTGTHAVGHRVNPFFSIPKIDLVRNPVQMDAAKHGLMMLPDRASMDQFMEGFRTSGIISKIPGLGPIADYYSHYLFHEYIPGLKFKTYEAILRRNTHVYAKDLAAGRVTPSDIKVLSSEQANAAYGHLNYADLARNPTMQHIAQIGLLAPDFLEARGRFAGQAIKGLGGAKVGREQLLALATLAIAQAAGAYVVSRIVDGEWDKKRPFEFVKGNRRYTVRSVPEDLVNLVTKTRQFIHSRLSPLVGKGTLQYLTGVDYRGQKVKALETTKELAAQPIPLTIRGFTGLGKSTLSGMEQLAGSLGLRISRYSPSLDVFDLVKEFKKSSDDPKLQADIEIQEKEVFSSVYDKLRTALRSGDIGEARKEYDKVKATRTPKQIDNAMKPWTGGNLNPRTLQVSPRKPKPFTGSAKTEKEFMKGLTPEQRATYDKAVQERLQFYNTFKQMLALPGPEKKDVFDEITVE